MDWWQVGLVILASITAGAGVGYLISYLFTLLSQRRSPDRPVVPTPVIRQQPSPISAPAVEKRPSSSVAPAAAERLETSTADLATEIKNNLEIARRPLTDRLVPFQSNAWNARQYQVDRLPADLRDDLEQLYTDIRLANSIVWVATEFNRRTSTLDENYTRLQTSIAERLARIRLQIEQIEKSRTY